MRSRYTIKSIVAAALVSALFTSCEKITEEADPCGRQIVVSSVQGDGIDNTNANSRASAIESSTDMRGQTFGIYASRTSNSSTYFTTTATVSSSSQSATMSPTQYWPIDQNGSLKIFSWYPYSGTYVPTVNFTTPAQMGMSYSANANAANHVDVMAAVTEPVWGSSVNIAFCHMLTKVTFTFKKVDPAPSVVTISSIEFQNVGKNGEYVVTQIPGATTKNGKANFVWSNTATGTITSTISSDNTVTNTAKQIGDTFLMLPASAFSETAKVVITTNIGVREFLLKDLVAATQHSWESGEYINYDVTITNTAYQMEAQALNWTDNPVNIIFDRDYYLKVSESGVLLGANGVTLNMTAETNYNATPSTGFSAGAFLSTLTNPGVAVTAVDLDWATVTLTETSVSGGIYTYNIRVVVSDYTHTNLGDSRWKGYYINAGNLRHQLSVMQWDGDGIWLTASVADDDTSVDRKKIVFTAGNPGWWAWEISGLSDPDDIFLNKETILGATGNLSQNEVYFYFKANAVSGKTATLTLTNTNGNNPPVSIVVEVP